MKILNGILTAIIAIISVVFSTWGELSIIDKINYIPLCDGLSILFNASVCCVFSFYISIEFYEWFNKHIK
jgi:hypothetical protein